MDKTFLCKLDKASTSYFPCNQGVFVEENLKIYLYGELNMPSKVYFCDVPNWTWQANETGVYYKNTVENKIYHVSAPGKRAKIICETQENFWMPHNRGGVFILEDKTGKLIFRGKSNPIKEVKGKKSLLWIFDIFSKSKPMFKDGDIVALNVPRSFFPFENGFFFRSNDCIYYHRIDTMENAFVCKEPKSGKWNAYYGQVLLAKGSGVYLELKNNLSILWQTDYTSFKGTKNGVIICEDYNILNFHSKPLWLQGTDSLLE